MEFSGGRGSAGWRVIAAVVFLLAILASYYWAHKPIDPNNGQDLAFVGVMGGALLDLLTVSLITMITGGLGRRIYSMIALESLAISCAERVALEGLLGLGILGWIALLLGMVGLFTGAALWLALLVIAVTCIRGVFGWLRDTLALARYTFRPEAGWSRFLAVIVLILLLLALLHTLTPPTAFDSINYHLVGPTRYLAAGRIIAYSDNHFLGFPQGVEILYGVAIGLFGRDRAAAPLHFVFGLLGLLAVGGLVRRYSNPITGWLSITLIMSAFSIWLLFGWPYVDLGMLAYGAAVLAAAVMWREQLANGAAVRWLTLMGVFGGLALGVKYTALGLLLGLGVFILVSSPRQAIRNGLIFGGVVLLAFLPWAIKGLLLYQNPIYPFVFGGLNWDVGRSNTFSTTGTGLLGSPNAWQLPILPLAASVFGMEKLDAVGYTFTVGPWLLTAPFLLLLGWRWLDERARGLARTSLLLGLPMLGFWMVMASLSSIGVQTRLMMMAMPVAAVLGALGFHSLSRWPRKPLNVYFIAQTLIGLTLVFTVIDAIRETVHGDVVPYLTGDISRDAYLDAHLGIYINAMRRLGELPEGSQVRLLFENRAYYCPVTITCVPDILFDHWPRPLRMGLSPDDVFQSWQDSGDDYVMLFNPGYAFSAEDTRFLDENALFPDALEDWMTPVWSDAVEGYTLYQWKE
jgi:hypothetical protein